MRLRDLKGLGPKSEEQLMQIGIKTPEDLRRVGAIPAFAALCAKTDIDPSMNFLYALVGALEDRHWQDVARKDRGRLLVELDGYQEMEKFLGDS